MPDLDAAITWYAENLGLVATHQETNDGTGGARGDAPRTRRRRGPGGAAARAAANESSTIAKFLDRNGPGLQQVAYRVTDVEASAAALRARALRLLYDAPRRGTAGSRVNFVHPKDAGGVLVELVEPAAEH